MNDGKLLGFLLVQVVAALVMACFVFLWPGPWNAARYVGMLLALTGIVLLFVGRFQLGKSFSVTPQARKLVTHGIYSRIRNPIYIFSFLMVIGVLLVVQKPSLFVLPVVLLVMQTLRARKEAQVLEEKFGQEYRDYRRKTWF